MSMKVMNNIIVIGVLCPCNDDHKSKLNFKKQNESLTQIMLFILLLLPVRVVIREESLFQSFRVLSADAVT